MKRLFKPGDRVQLKSGGPVMIVQKYAKEKSHLLGHQESDHIAECSCYTNNGFVIKTFHQNSLMKVRYIKPYSYRLSSHSFHY